MKQPDEKSKASGGGGGSHSGGGGGGGATLAALVPKHVFGVKVDVKSHVHFLDEAVVAFPCGHSTVIYSMETKEQHLIHAQFAPRISAPQLLQGRTSHSSMSTQQNVLRRFRFSLSLCSQSFAIDTVHLVDRTRWGPKQCSARRHGAR